MSPRRSSRGRSSALPPQPPSQTASSTSTSTMKNPHPVKRSESIDDPNLDDDASQSQAPTSEPAMPRRSRRNGVEETKQPVDTNVEDEEEFEGEQATEQEEEITRCICGHAEYPGPSPHARDLGSATRFLDALGDDLGNFFVQCDRCGVWQHGGCMGLIDEQNLPDQYFCELCKPELHRIMRGSNGTKSSRYLPVLQLDSSRSSSLSSNDQHKKEGKGKQEPAKRRATMNSRVAYDDDELLRRAIEESREMGTLGKRSREDVDEFVRSFLKNHPVHAHASSITKPPVKRQRTGSDSSDAASKRSMSPGTIDEIPGRTASRGKQSLRGAVAKTNREREMREKQKEQTAVLRAEAASKRNARSERRRVDDSPPPTPSLSPSKHLATNPATTKSKADTPTPTSVPTTKSKSKPRSAPTRRGRLGRNQYTRDRDGGADSDTPMRDTSLDRNVPTTVNGTGSSGGNGTGTGNGAGNGTVNGTGESPQGSKHDRIIGESGRSSKVKTHPARTSMNEMRRRVAGILEFVGQMQTQAQTKSRGSSGGGSGKGGTGSGGATPSGTADVGGSLGVAGLVRAVQAARDDVEKAASGNEGTSVEARANVEEATVNHLTTTGPGGTGDSGATALTKIHLRDDTDFRCMGSGEMMETLTRELVGWQSVYGVYSR